MNKQSKYTKEDFYKRFCVKQPLEGNKNFPWQEAEPIWDWIEGYKQEAYKQGYKQAMLNYTNGEKVVLDSSDLRLIEVATSKLKDED